MLAPKLAAALASGYSSARCPETPALAGRRPDLDRSPESRPARGLASVAIIRPGSHNRLHGPRRDEALYLRTHDLDLTSGVIRLVSHRQRPLKTATSRRLIPIPPELREILEAWLPQCQSVWLFPGIRRETPWRGGRLGHRPIDALRAAAQAAGVACPGWHALRHSWITHARTRWGIPDAIVALIAGHTSIAMTDRYTHADAANLALGIERISYREEVR